MMRTPWYSRQRRPWKRSGDKIAANDKAAVEADLKCTEGSHQPRSGRSMTDAQVEDIKAGREKLMNSAQKLFAKVYEQAQASGAGRPGRS